MSTTRIIVEQVNKSISDGDVRDRVAAVKAEFNAQFGKGYALPPISKFEKYNEKKVIRAQLTKDALNALLKYDDEILGLPKFLADFLDIKPSQHRETLVTRPELIFFSEDKKYIIMPNPAQINHEQLMQNPKQAKINEEGFGLIAWFIHPSLLLESKYSDKDTMLASIKQNGESLRYGIYGDKETLQRRKRINSFSQLLERDSDKSTVSQVVAKSNIPYLSGPFDYKNEDLESLISLRKQVLSHLKEVYDVDESDRVELYFHTHYSITTNTMHLHIRVNQYHHGLEFDKSIKLDDIIDCLSQGKEVKEVFSERCILHKEMKSAEFLNSLGYKTEVVANPYYLEKKKK